MTGVSFPGQIEAKPTFVHSAAWDALMHDSGACVAVLDAQLIIRVVNSSLCVFLDVAPSDLIGKSYADILETSGRGTRLAAIERVLATGKPVAFKYVAGNQARLITYRACRGAEVPGGLGLIFTCRELAISEQVDPTADVIDERSAEPNPLSSLSDREQQVLCYIAEGLSSAEIAQKLHRSVKTVEGHRARLGYKLGARNRAELTRLAISLGLVKANAQSKTTTMA